jgi:uncharacterized membrane protein
MTLSAISGRNLAIMLALTILLLFVTEPALALNVEKVGKGLVGNERLKLRWLREYMFYFGIFFVVLGGITTAFRKHKFALQKRSDTHPAMGPFIIVIGVLFMLPRFFY